MEYNKLEYLQYLNEDTDISIVNSLIDNFDLKPQQLGAVRESVLNKTGGVWIVEMGLGKTIITLGLVTALAPLLQNNLTIITAQTITVESFYKYLVENTQLSVIMTNGEASNVNYTINQVENGRANCIVCTQSAWTYSLEFNVFVYNNIDKIKCMVYDECEGKNDNGFLNFIEVAHHTPFTFPANATPTGEKIDILYNLLYAVNATDLKLKEFRKKYCYYVTVGDKSVEKTKFDLIDKDFSKYLINFNRRDVGAETTYKDVKFHRCDLSQDQTRKLEMGIPRSSILYTPDSENVTPISIPAFIALIQSIMSKPVDSNKLIYCWHRNASDMIANVFRNMGMKVFQIDGYNTEKSYEKDYVEKQYNSTKGAVMITSIDVGSNLDSADHVFIYETPPEIGQYIARAARGYKSKELTLDWIYYPSLESDTLFKAAHQCVKTATIGKRETTLLDIIVDEIKDMYPSDVRLTDLLRDISMIPK